MTIDDIRKAVDDLWLNTSAYWKDEAADKYEKTSLQEMRDILDEMKENGKQLEEAACDALRGLDEA